MSKLSYLGERSESGENVRASGEASRGQGKESLQRSLINFHLYFAQTKGNTTVSSRVPLASLLFTIRYPLNGELAQRLITLVQELSTKRHLVNNFHALLIFLQVTLALSWTIHSRCTESQSGVGFYKRRWTYSTVNRARKLRNLFCTITAKRVEKRCYASYHQRIKPFLYQQIRLQVLRLKRKSVKVARLTGSRQSCLTEIDVTRVHGATPA